MRRKDQLTVVATLVAGLFCGVEAKAGLVYNNDATLTVGVESGTLTVGSGAVNLDGTSEGNFYLGAITLSGTILGQPASFSSVCTDFRGVVYIGSTYNFSEQQYSGLTGLNPHWGATLDQASASAAIQNAADIFAKHSGAVTYGSATRAEWWAALQLAVWDALYNTKADGTIDTSSGARFQVNSAVVTDNKVTTLLNNWLQPSSTEYAGNILLPVIQQNGEWVPNGPPSANPGAQGMLYNVTPVPEVTTLLAGALLLLPFGFSTLRVVRNKGRK